MRGFKWWKKCASNPDEIPVERVDRNLHSHQINSNTSTSGNVNHRLLMYTKLNEKCNYDRDANSKYILKLAFSLKVL